MDAHQATAGTAGPPDTPPAAGARPAAAPHGRWLPLARAACVAVALLIVTLWAISVPLHYHQHVTLTSPSMDDPAAIRATLAQSGLSVAVYAGYTMALELAVTLAFCAAAAVLFWRRSADPMALLVALFLVALGVGFPGTLKGLAEFQPAWIAADRAVTKLGLVLFGLVFFLFPDGRFAPRWTRWPAAGWVAALALAALFPGSPVDAETWPPPLFPLVFGAFAGAMIYAQVHRYRRVATPTQRQQTKWVVFGLTAALAGFIGFAFLPLFAPSLDQKASLYDLVSTTIVLAGLLLIPLSLALAILRHRLWEIDHLINRALVYAALTAGVVGLYVLAVGALGALFQAGGDLLASLLATGLVAVLFQPLRERLQRAVNRLLYGERDEPYAALARLGQRLEAALDPAAVLPTLVRTVAQALKLPYAAIALTQDGAVTVAAAFGAAREPGLRLPLAYGGAAIGELALAPRAPGEPFSAADRRLLGDLARQAGVAAHAVLLTADLERSRRRVVAAREEARRRLGSDLHDGLGHRLAGLLRQADRAAGLLEADPAAARRALADLAGQARALIAEVRGLAHALHPPDLELLGLAGALRERVHQLAGPDDDGVQVSVEAPAALPPLPAAVEAAAYYIAQEALANVARHAGARHCRVRLALVSPAAGERSLLTPADAAVLELEIGDDGRGLPPDGRVGGGLGLASMRERAAELGGSCVVEPAGAHGARVYARLPVTAVDR